MKRFLFFGVCFFASKSGFFVLFLTLLEGLGCGGGGGGGGGHLKQT